MSSLSAAVLQNFAWSSTVDTCSCQFTEVSASWWLSPGFASTSAVLGQVCCVRLVAIPQVQLLDKFVVPVWW